MKKVTMFFFVLLLFVSIFGFSPNLYFNLKAGAWFQTNSDQDPFITTLYGNSNMGITFIRDDVTAQFELGRDGGTRIMRATIPFLNGELTVGKTYIPGASGGSAQGADPSFSFDSPFPGVIFMNREHQVSYSTKSGLTATILGPISAPDVTTGTPKVVLAWELPVFDGVIFTPVFGYGQAWGDSTHVACLGGVSFKSANVQGQFFIAGNPADLGLVTIPDVDDVGGGWIQLRQGKLSLGGGYCQEMSSGDGLSAGTVFLNYKLASNNVSFIPEVGYFYGDGFVSENTAYAGLKMVVAIE